MSTQDTCQESVYNELFRKIAPLLRNFLCYKYKAIDSAEDMVQEAFMVLWKNCKQVMPDMAKAYLFRVAQNQILKLVDKEKVKQKHFHSLVKPRIPKTHSFRWSFQNLT